MDASSNLGIIEKDDAIIGMMFEHSNVDTVKSLEDYLFLNDCSSRFVVVNSVNSILKLQALWNNWIALREKLMEKLISKLMKKLIRKLMKMIIRDLIKWLMKFVTKDMVSMI